MTRPRAGAVAALAALLGLAVTDRPAAATDSADGPDGEERCATRPWPLWQAYVENFVAEDGRVLDPTGGGRSTSEGQAYAAFHALVADDRETFERVVGWADLNLASGALGRQLPGWLWDRRKDGSLGLTDGNAASDADLWLAYALLEAGRLWDEPRHTRLGRELAARVVEQEVRVLPGLGPARLPGPEGFVLAADRGRRPPRYLPRPLRAGLEAHGVPGPWEALRGTTVRMIREGSPHGFAPDWIAYHREEGFGPDPIAGRAGSHDAIRTYLWAGLMHDDDPLKGTVGMRLGGMLRHWREAGDVPERVDAWSGQVQADGGPVGFLAALVPEVIAVAEPDELGHLVGQIGQHAHGGLFGDPPTYYDQNLLLFALGAAEDRYRFAADGTLETAGGCER